MRYLTTIMLAVVFMAGVAHAQLITDNLVYYWQFESNLVDSAGNNNMEAVYGGTGAAPTYPAGQVGTYSVELSGPTGGGNWEYLRTINAVTNTVLGSSNRTLNIWFYADAIPTTHSSPVSYGTIATVDDLFEFLCLTTGFWEGHFWGSFRETGTAVSDYSATTWTMATLVHDGANVTVYEDGVQQTVWAGGALSTVIGVTDDSEALIVGGSNTLLWNFWDGRVDDVALWSRVLSSNEVYSVWQAGNAGNNIYSLAGVPGTMVYGK